MEPGSLEVAEVHAAALLDPDLLGLVQEIEAHRLYPQVIAAHVACVQMDTSLPRLAQLEVDLSAAQRSMMGAVPESHSSKPGPEAAGPVEVDDFMAECLAHLVGLKAALESHVAAALHSCEDIERRLLATLRHSATPFLPRLASPGPAGPYHTALDQGGSSAPGPKLAAEVKDNVLIFPRSGTDGPSGVDPSTTARGIFAPQAGMGAGCGRDGGRPALNDPVSTRSGAAGVPPREGDQHAGRASTEVLIRRCLQRDAQLEHAERGASSGGAGPGADEERAQGGGERGVADTMARELKDKLEDQYSETLEEVRNEIWRKRRAGRLPGSGGHLLREWWSSHETWPYPTDGEKRSLALQTGLSVKQVSNWFINQRKRNWKQ